MGNEMRQHGSANLPPGEADLAGRAVFVWTLLPAAARLTHEVMAGHDAEEPVDELRAAVRLLDTLGWPDDVPTAAELTAEEAEVVRHAARIQVTNGLDPDADVRGRIARGRADQLPHVGGAMLRLLQRLEPRG